MKLETIWVVIDPTPRSTLDEIFFEEEVCRLGDYIIGSGPGTWLREHTSLYTTREEALKDAQGRIRKRDFTVARLVQRSDGRVVKVTVPED
jgi:hypothetical protein